RRRARQISAGEEASIEPPSTIGSQPWRSSRRYRLRTREYAAGQGFAAGISWGSRCQTAGTVSPIYAVLTVIVTYGAELIVFFVSTAPVGGSLSARTEGPLRRRATL